MLQRANRAANFDTELIEDQNFFIPQRSVASFIDTIMRASGEDRLGLLLVPNMDVSTYGTFGRYITEAATLGQAITRSIMALRYHSTYDDLFVTLKRDELQLSYRSPLHGAAGYDAIASAAAGELLSFFRAYLPDTWRPLWVELDIPAPKSVSVFETVFQCPVRFDAGAVTIAVERHRLMALPRRAKRSLVTIEDVARDRPGGAPHSLVDVAIAQIRARLGTGEVAIEEVASSMSTSVRTLQRGLHKAGVDFRSLTGIVRIQRATELLQDVAASVTDVAAELGYSSLPGFSRAFQKATGFWPRQFRAQSVALSSGPLTTRESDLAE